MNDEYKIIDTRTNEDFKKSTFSGYKKRDVYNVLYKSMDTKKVENACNWITECVVVLSCDGCCWAWICRCSDCYMWIS